MITIVPFDVEIFSFTLHCSNTKISWEDFLPTSDKRNKSHGNDAGGRAKRSGHSFFFCFFFSFPTASWATDSCIKESFIFLLLRSFPCAQWRKLFSLFVLSLVELVLAANFGCKGRILHHRRYTAFHWWPNFLGRRNKCRLQYTGTIAGRNSWDNNIDQGSYLLGDVSKKKKEVCCSLTNRRVVNFYASTCTTPICYRITTSPSTGSIVAEVTDANRRRIIHPRSSTWSWAQGHAIQRFTITRISMDGETTRSNKSIRKHTVGWTWKAKCLAKEKEYRYQNGFGDTSGEHVSLLLLLLAGCGKTNHFAFSSSTGFALSPEA